MGELTMLIMTVGARAIESNIVSSLRIMQRIRNLQAKTAKVQAG